MARPRRRPHKRTYAAPRVNPCSAISAAKPPIWLNRRSSRRKLLETTLPGAPALSRGQEVRGPLAEHTRGSVSLGEVARLAFGSLMANKVRSLLTMLGVIIGVASVVALLAIGNGASAAITGQIQSIGTNVLTVMPGSPNNRGPGNSGAAQTLTLADSEAIAALKLPITGPSPQFGGSAQIVAPAADKSATVTGVTATYQPINSLTLSAGSFISDEQVRGANTVVVLGNMLATDLFGSGQAIGQTVRIKDQTF